MIATSPSLAVERAALVALHDAANDDLRERLGLVCAPVGGGLLSAATPLPETAIVINRALGVSANEIDAVAARYATLGVERYFVQLEADPGLDRGPLEPTRNWQTFACAAPAQVETNASVTVVEIDASRGEDFARVVCSAFDIGSIGEPWLAKLPGAGGWRVFLGLIDGHVAGVGALFQDGTHAWCDFGATATEFRRRGVQRALLHHRVKAAFSAGATRVYTCTGVAVPGEAQSSYHNILACGFGETDIKFNLAPRKAS